MSDQLDVIKVNEEALGPEIKEDIPPQNAIKTHHEFNNYHDSI